MLICRFYPTSTHKLNVSTPPRFTHHDVPVPPEAPALDQMYRYAWSTWIETDRYIPEHAELFRQKPVWMGSRMGRSFALHAYASRSRVSLDRPPRCTPTVAYEQILDKRSSRRMTAHHVRRSTTVEGGRSTCDPSLDHRPVRRLIRRSWRRCRVDAGRRAGNVLAGRRTSIMEMHEKQTWTGE